MLNVLTKSQPIYAGDIHLWKMYYFYHMAKKLYHWIFRNMQNQPGSIVWWWVTAIMLELPIGMNYDIDLEFASDVLMRDMI